VILEVTFSNEFLTTGLRETDAFAIAKLDFIRAVIDSVTRDEILELIYALTEYPILQLHQPRGRFIRRGPAILAVFSSVANKEIYERIVELFDLKLVKRCFRHGLCAAFVIDLVMSWNEETLERVLRLLVRPLFRYLLKRSTPPQMRSRLSSLLELIAERFGLTALLYTRHQQFFESVVDDFEEYCLDAKHRLQSIFWNGVCHDGLDEFLNFLSNPPLCAVLFSMVDRLDDLGAFVLGRFRYVLDQCPPASWPACFGKESLLTILSFFALLGLSENSETRESARTLARDLAEADGFEENSIAGLLAASLVGEAVGEEELQSVVEDWAEQPM
jgi:hypothetical protein